MMGTILLALLALVLLVLLWPVKYRISLSRWRLGIRISILSGLWSKEIEFATEEEAPAVETDGEEEAPAVGTAPEKPAKRKEISPIEKEEPLEIEDILKEAETAAEEKEEPPAEIAGEEEVAPSTWAQIRFAIHNGLVERVFAAATALLSHSFPKHFSISGEFGTGDPMTTGTLGGIAAAFAGGATEKVVWNYLEPVNTLQGSCRGRIIPIYVIYIAGRLLLAKPLWEFKKFRKGNYHG